jgi:hypothetical protein
MTKGCQPRDREVDLENGSGKLRLQMRLHDLHELNGKLREGGR